MDIMEEDNNTKSGAGGGIHSLADFEASLPEEERISFRDAQLVFTLNESENTADKNIGPNIPKDSQAGGNYPRGALWLGGQFSVRDSDTLLKRGTTHILTCNGRRPFFFPGKIQPDIKVIDWDDEDQQELDELRGALDFLKNALLSGGVVLIHCTAGRSRSAAVVLAFFIECMGMSCDEALAALKLKRPWVDYFMERAGERWEVVVFTASLAKYADPLLDLLDKKTGVIRHRLFRESCYPFQGNYVKDLTSLGREMTRCVIVDNSPHSYAFQPQNALPVASFIDDPRDNDLLDLLPYLDELAEAKDVTETLVRNDGFVPRRTFHSRGLPVPHHRRYQ